MTARVRILPEFLFDTADVGQGTTERTIEGLYHLKRLSDLMSPDPREWEYRGDVADAGAPVAKCSCGHPIRYVFTIWHKTDGRGLPIGSVCIETSVPVLISQGAGVLASALTAAVEKLKAQIEEAKKRERDALNDATAYELAKEYESLLAWCHDSRDAMLRSRCSWLPTFLYRIPTKPKPCSSPGRTVASLAQKYSSLWIAAQGWTVEPAGHEATSKCGLASIPTPSHTRLLETIRTKIEKERYHHMVSLKRMDDVYQGNVPQHAKASILRHTHQLAGLDKTLNLIGGAS